MLSHAVRDFVVPCAYMEFLNYVPVYIPDKSRDTLFNK